MGFIQSRIPGESKRESTFIIAASNSPNYLKNQADFVATGVSDQNTINNAINQLPIIGGKIKLLEGTFNVDDSINLVSNCNLQGQGPGTIIKIPSGSVGTIYPINVSSKENIFIENLLVDCNNIANSRCINIISSSNILITRCILKNAPVAAVRSGLSDPIEIANNRIINSYVGCEIREQNNTNIIANVISSCGWGTYIYNSNYAVISGNIIIDSPQQDGVLLTGSSYCVVVNNVIHDSTDKGIEIANSSSYNIISANSVRKSSVRGINLVTGCTRNIISNNTINESNGHGLVVSDSCTNNDILNNYIESASQTTTNTYSSIYIETNSSYNNVQNNTCRVGGLTNKPKYGIAIADAGCTGNLVTNNDLYNSGVTASLLNSGTGTVTTAGNRL